MKKSAGIGMGWFLLLGILALIFWPRKSTGTDGSNGGDNGDGGDTGGGGSGGNDLPPGTPIMVAIELIGTGVVPPSFNTTSGTPMYLEAYSVSGWHFVEWRIDGVKYATSPLLTYTPTKSVTLTAVFEIDAEPIPTPEPGVISLGIVNAPGSGVNFAEYRYWAAQINGYLSPAASPADGNISKRWTFAITGNSVTGYFVIVIWDHMSNELLRDEKDSVTITPGNWNYNCATRQIERA